MVARHSPMLKLTKMESRNLKFGVDRILSPDVSSTPTGPQDNCTTVTSCIGCLSTFHRPSRPCPFVHLTPFYKNEVLIPQPLRPFTNVLFSTEGNITEFGEKESEAGNKSKRKRSWSRAVFSNLQRKGLEKRFQLQKYITKPDRRQLAATLGLTDAQVKVWFQNRRMKWRHSKEPFRQKTTERKTSTSASDSETCARHNPDSGTESDVDIDIDTIPQ